MILNLLNRSSDKELVNLLNKLNVKDFVVIPRSLLKDALNNPNINNIIFNLGDSTHWVSLNKQKKYYFDSFGQSPPPEISNYKYNTKIIQDFEDSDCGQLCCLFLYYINYKDLNSFYKMFKTRYDY